MTTAEVLRAARAKIEQGWCQGESARGSRGTYIDPAASEAQEWCPLGALDYVCYRNAYSYYDGARTALAKAMRSASVSDWNDMLGRTKEEVLAAFDRAIAAAEAGA